MEAALLRLFNAVQIDSKRKKNQSNSLLSRTVKRGYILHPAIKPTEELLSTIESIIGISGEKANAAFHKSWEKIATASIEQLIIEQFLHYITTYGFEYLGIYDKDTVYIPLEELKIPEVTKIPLTVIKALTKEEILEKIVESFGSGIALSQETLDDIMLVIKTNQYTSEFVENIKNRELKMLLYNYYDIVPQQPEEFLRFLIIQLTGESLVIKNTYLIDKIKNSSGGVLDKYMQKAPKNLASIFLRYKPLFLAMKSISKNKSVFNKLRKQATKLHKPLPVDYFNDITSQIKHGTLDNTLLNEKLSETNIFRKIRLAYALKYRMNSSNSIVYVVRNGRGYATEFEWKKSKNSLEIAYHSVLASIVQDIKPAVEGKNIYIPPYIHYALPATEKQFIGNFPIGSYVCLPNKDLIIGIHWYNKEERNYYEDRIDLDLSLMEKNKKYGWDSSYRDDKKNILFSGDVTDAPYPHGASELFYVKNTKKEQTFIVYLNIFSGPDEVPCKIFVADEQRAKKSLPVNYMVNTNNILAQSTINVSKKQNVLGIIKTGENENRFYFSNVSVGKSITSLRGEQSRHTLEYFTTRFSNPINFRILLHLAGAILLTEKPADETEFIDLSPEALDKTTIFDLVRPQ